MDDKQKSAQLTAMLPYPTGLVRPKEGMTCTSTRLERNGLVPIVVTYRSTPSEDDFDSLSELRFWPVGRTPLSKESACIGAEESEEESSSEKDSVVTSEADSAN